MNILVVGSGGREHALCWRLAQSDNCRKLYCAPGNAGIEECAELVDIGVDNIDALTKFAKDNDIDLVVIGPEIPLVLGLADRLKDSGIAAFGPSQVAAQLEGSKGFMKDLCARYGVPSAGYGRFTDIAAAKTFIDKNNLPIVIKADGLAAGKGVIIAQTKDEAYTAVNDMLTGNAFGAAGQSLVIEEFLDGDEISFFALSDGKDVIPFGSAQDHKRAGDNDTGLNTGGMGAISPAPQMTDELQKKIMERLIIPVIDGMARENIPFVGVLFAGIMMVKGEPILLEFNTRFGDPECQTLMMRLASDPLDILQACATGTLAQIKDTIRWREEPAVCIVMAARGYPGSYDKNTVISGISQADTTPQTKVFHAGTARDKDGKILSIGGRVLGITSFADSITTTRARAYEAAAKIDWPEGFYRSDIGVRAERYKTG